MTVNCSDTEQTKSRLLSAATSSDKIILLARGKMKTLKLSLLD